MGGHRTNMKITKFLTGRDYPQLCSTCRSTIDQVATALAEVGEDTDNTEAPCDYVYDHSMFCGGRQCTNRSAP